MIEFTAFASGSSGNCYLVSDGKSRLLIDPGIPYKRIQVALDFRIATLDGALISHGHLDHCEAAGKLMEAGVDCYASAETWARGVKGSVPHRMKLLSDRREAAVAAWRVLPFEVPHDIHTLAFLITGPSSERMIYVTDAMYCPVNFRDWSNIKLLAVECNHDIDTLLANKRAGLINPARANRTVSTHTSLSTTLGFFRANKDCFSNVEQIFLLHLSAENADAMRFKAEVEACTGRPVKIAGQKEVAA